MAFDGGTGQSGDGDLIGIARLPSGRRLWSGPVFGGRAFFRRTKLPPGAPVAAHGVELETFLNGECAGENAEEIDLVTPTLLPAIILTHSQFDLGGDRIGLVLVSSENHGDVLKIGI